jgi:hypothetical protein
VDIKWEEIPYTREKKPQIFITELPKIITQKETLGGGVDKLLYDINVLPIKL